MKQPPLIAEIGELHRRLDAERRAEVPDFVTIKDLRNRLNRLVAAARKGWHMDGGDDNSRPPAAAKAA